MYAQRLGPGGCQGSSASASAIGPAAAASATAVTHGADIGKDQRTRSEGKQTTAPMK